MKNMRKLAKRLTLFMALSLMVGTYSGAMAYGNNNISCFKAKEAMTVDGDLSEWNTSSPAVLSTLEQVVRDPGQWTGPEDVSMETYLMWDEGNLYLAAKLMDDTPFMYREGFPPDMADSMVLFLSTDPDADENRTEYTASDFRLTMVIDDYYYNTGIDREMIADKQGFESIGADGDEQVLSGYECAIQEIEGGYTFEAKIPFANFANESIPVLVPRNGMTVGLDLGMFDLDFPCPGVATVRIQWCASADADTNPSLWGRMTLCE